MSTHADLSTARGKLEGRPSCGRFRPPWPSSCAARPARLQRLRRGCRCGRSPSSSPRRAPQRLARGAAPRSGVARGGRSRSRLIRSQALDRRRPGGGDRGRPGRDRVHAGPSSSLPALGLSCAVRAAARPPGAARRRGRRSRATSCCFARLDLDHHQAPPDEHRRRPTWPRSRRLRRPAHAARPRRACGSAATGSRRARNPPAPPQPLARATERAARGCAARLGPSAARDAVALRSLPFFSFLPLSSLAPCAFGWRLRAAALGVRDAAARLPRVRQRRGPSPASVSAATAASPCPGRGAVRRAGTRR